MIRLYIMEAIEASIFGTTANIPKEQIYKIYQLNKDNKIHRIVIFNGNKDTVLNLNDWFSEIEIADIGINNTQIVFTNAFIRYDDTIRAIKRKVLGEMDRNVISYPELYLFANKKQQIDLFNIYNTITRNDKLDFKQNMLAQLLQNLHIQADMVENIPELETYNYETLFKYLPINNTNIDIDIPVGQQFSSYRDLLYPSNPYDNISSVEMPFKQTAENNLITFEKDLLLNYGPIVNNVLYVCCVDDVLHYADTIGLDNEYMISMYFPVLATHDVSSKEDIVSIRQELIMNDSEISNDETIQQYNNDIDTLYKIHNLRTSELPNVKKGITDIDLIMHPELSTILPLEVIFKNIHATEDLPFIKYNPGSRQENIYRLYSDKLSKGGKKIPFLKRQQIVNLSKIGGSREILLYIKATCDNLPTDLYLTISHNGNIHIKCAFENPISSDMLNEFLKDSVNDIINRFNDFLKSTGYKINTFVDIEDSLLEIQNISYMFETSLNANAINFNKYLICLTSLFEVLEHSPAGPLTMSYKRVDNYTKMNSIQSMITNIYQSTNSERAVIEALVLNYNMTEEQSLMEVAKYLNDFHQVNGRYVNKSFDILENQGFNALLKTSQLENKIALAITNINNIGYVQLIDVYMDSLFRIMINPDTTRVSSDEIKNICQTKRKTIQSDEETILIVPSVNKLTVTEDVNDEPFDDEDDDGFIFFDDDEENGEEDDDEENDEEDDDEENETNEEDEDELTGGAKKKTAFIAEEKANANVFYNKMRRLEPKIILARKEGQFNAYSRTCPANTNRQPVILTNEEKQRIDNENRNAYSYALEYGHDPDNKHWFICPRYWCMKTNMPVTEQDIKDGKCEKKDVHEFTDNKYHVDKDGNYVQHNPGLASKGHPTHGVPCCFGKSWNSNQLKKTREKYNVTADNIDAPEGVIINDDDKDKKNNVEIPETSNLYVVGFDKYPIPKNRWGFLPPAIQLFLDINYKQVITKKNPALIKSNAPTFLRYGVEQNEHQSFIGCIADIYASVNKYKENNQPTPSIKEMRNILVDSITIDMYLQFQNGSLVTLFQPNKLIIERDILLKYEDSQFYKGLDNNADAEMNFYEHTVASFEHFLKYLKDDDAWIDHTYLWDIVTSVNSKLFPSGLNLVLLQIMDNDITDNVELICPSNSYLSNAYDPRRETVILLKHDAYYEPVYLYQIIEDESNDIGNIIQSKETFSQQIASSELKKVLGNIQNIIGNYCKPRASMPKQYQFKTNLLANDLLRLLRVYNYKVQTQVINYRGKVIGLMVKDNNENPWEIFVPTFPSAIINNIEVKQSDDIMYTNYLNTVNTLLQIHSKSEHSILCKPMLKVVEDELIVGILTETNQFVQIDPPVPNDIDDGIDTLYSTGYSDNNYAETDKQLAINREEDSIRLNTIRNIKLEGQFYSAFRTILRIALSKYENYEFRDQILKLLNNKQYTYQVALRKMEMIIRHILKDTVLFAKYKTGVLNKMSSILDIEETYQKTQYCLVSEDDDKSCKLVIPSINLVSNRENNLLYFKRISDELLRYKRIRLFILEPKRHLNIGSSEYKLNDNELLLLQTLLDGNYFDDLVPIKANEYINNITYDMAEPSIHQKYSTEVTIQEQNAKINNNDTSNIFIAECIKETMPSVIGNQTSYWKQVLPAKSREIVFNNTHNCTFFALIDVINKHTKRFVSIQLVKNALCRKYSEHMNDNQTKLLRILQLQHGKRKMIERVIRNEINLEDLIMSEEYYITNLDLWAIASIFNLPILLFSQKPLANLGLSVQWVVLGGDRIIDNYYCIRSPANSKELPEYHLVTPACKLSEIIGFSNMVNNPEYAENNLTFDAYMNTYQISIDK